MAYYDTIRSPRDFVQAASSQGALSFAALQQSNYWESGASRWGIRQLFACRVICRQPSDILPLLADQIHSARGDRLHPCISGLIQGPKEESDQLQQMAEIQIVHSYQPESLGTATYLQIHSTNWFDVSRQTGRKYFVRHLLALVAWADTIMTNSGLYDSEDSEDAGDLMDMEE